MAAHHSLLAQATHALQRKIEAGKKVRESHKAEEAVIVCSVASLGGSAAAGMLDAKTGKGGAAAMLFKKADGTGGVPTNIVAGLAITIPAVAIPKFPAKGAVAAGGLAMLGAGVYRYIVDHVKPAAPAAT